MNKAIWLVAAVLMSAPSAAFAGHGKAGLWNVTSTTDMAMAMPPEVATQMKQAGMKMPKPAPITRQMCMSQSDVDSDKPPQIDPNASGCDTKLIKAGPSGIEAQMTCSGKMKGTGHMQIAYSAPEHYAGSYSFKGTVEGNPTSMSTSFKGDWVKKDCGAVKPYKLR